MEEIAERSGISLYDIIFQRAKIADGSGKPCFVADVAIKDGFIAKIGKVDSDAGDQIINAEDRVLAPGFIDIHSHGDLSAPAFPNMESCVLQGITTVFGGHCGMGAAPADKYWRYTFFEDAAFIKAAPAPAGGQCPGKGQLLEREALIPAFRDAFGFELDWTHMGEYFSHLERAGIGANLVCVTGHGQLRQQVLGTDDKREATKQEIEEMKKYLRRDLENGSRGLSFGLDYEPGVYASDTELLELAACTAEYGGLLTTHCQRRNFRRGIVEKQYYINGLREVLEIARRTGVQLHISHITSGYEVAPPDPLLCELAAKRTLELVEDYCSRGVSVSWDVIPPGCGGEMFHFPYLATKLIPYVDQCGGLTAFADRLRLETYRTSISREIWAGRHQSRSPFTRLDPVENPGWAEDAVITRCVRPEFEGMSLGDLARERNEHFVDTILYLVAEDPWICWDRPKSIQRPGAEYFLSRPDASVCLDGGVFSMEYPAPADYPQQFAAPSSYCGMIKFLKERLDRRESLEGTIAKMTGNSAKKIGLTDRGFIREGLAADLVLLREDTLSANESRVDPRQAPSGVELVLVNGKAAAKGGVHLAAKAGKTLRYPSQSYR